jgi:hypothetical protein
VSRLALSVVITSSSVSRVHVKEDCKSSLPSLVLDKGTLLLLVILVLRRRHLLGRGTTTSLGLRGVGIGVLVGSLATLLGSSAGLLGGGLATAISGSAVLALQLLKMLAMRRCGLARFRKRRET